MASPPDARTTGFRLLRAALALVVVLTLSATIWAVVTALQNPDVRTKRPRWLDATSGFDASFWIPLIITLVVGFGLVFAVFWKALRRMQSGEDLYTDRFGRGQRRRAERFLGDGASPKSRESNSKASS